VVFENTRIRVFFFVVYAESSTTDRAVNSKRTEIRFNMAD